MCFKVWEEIVNNRSEGNAPLTIQALMNALQADAVFL